jgi:hypothetical protein
MGCKHSVEATGGVDVTPTHTSDETTNLVRSGETHESSKSDFTKDYKVIKRVGGVGSVSSIYMVVKNNEQSQRTVTDDEDDMYVLQVIDMKSVVPERRSTMKTEIQSLTEIRHPNSKYIGSGTQAHT